jgi:methylmalonyl-CoA/ethylmalonyl-CoA epimerase
MANEVKLSSIGQIAVTARDVDRAEAFYRDVLGMKHLFSFPGMAFFDCGGVRLMLSAPESPEFDHASSIIYYKVDNIHAAYQIIAARGAVSATEPHLIVTMPEHELWMAGFHDSEGNYFCLMSEVPLS